MDRIPFEWLERPCDDKHLLELSLAVTQWQSISPFLGLDQTDEEEIVELYQPRRRGLQMLRKWKEKKGRSATYRNLVISLNRVKRQDLVELLINSIRKDVRTSAQVVLPSQSRTRPVNQQGLLPWIINFLYSIFFIKFLYGLLFGTNKQPNTPLQTYREYLQHWYQCQTPSFSTQWPPPSTNKVFNLAMISKQKVERRILADSAFVQLTLHGAVDDIMELKTPVKLEDIFTVDEAYRKVILIEGAPGSGKTTLAWHICHEWGSGKLFQEFDVVVLVSLRDPCTQSAQSLFDLLPVMNASQLCDVVTELHSKYGNGILWVLDGWDELPSPLQQSSLFHQLLCPSKISHFFQQSAVIVTSRPISSADLHPLVSSRIELIGFTDAQIKEYLLENLEYDHQAMETLQHHLAQNPEVESSCYLPMNAAIVVHLFLALGCSLPNSLHKTFCLIVFNCIFRYLKNRVCHEGELPSLTTIEESSVIIHHFPPDIQEHFRKICKLAYIGIKDEKLIFFLQDLKSFGLSVPLCSLGLLREVESFVSMGKSVSYNFLHLSVQELLAAFHISEMFPEDQVRTFKSMVGYRRFNYVIQFYAGITKLQTPGIQMAITDIIKGRDDFDLISVIRCLHETQNVDDLCLSLADMLQWKLNISMRSTLTPSDCLSIGYFLSCVCHCCKSPQKMFFANLFLCSLNDKRIEYLMRGLLLCEKSVSTTDVCKLVLNLQHSTNIHSKGAFFIAKTLKCSVILSHLILAMGSNHIGEDALKSIVEALVSNCSLVQLDLSKCSMQITDFSGPLVVEMLQKNKSLHFLNMSSNNISNSGAAYIGRGLGENTVLKTINLEMCGITAAGAESLASALAVNKSLEELDLSCNNISNEGAAAISEFLSLNINLKTLSLDSCDITEMELLSGSLRKNTSLEVLKLGANNIGDKGARLLAESLKGNKTLSCLTLHNNRISDAGVEDLAEMLIVNNTIKKLDLKFNPIQGPGIVKLGTTLKINQSLQELELWLKHDSVPDLQHHCFKQFSQCLSFNVCLTKLSFKLCNECRSIMLRDVNSTRRMGKHPELNFFMIREVNN